MTYLNGNFYRVIILVFIILFSIILKDEVKKVLNQVLNFLKIKIYIILDISLYNVVAVEQIPIDSIFV